MIGHDQIEYASITDPGIRRPQNEDNQAVSLAVDDDQWQRQGHIFLVADGMGGHAVGELASELAASLIPHTYHKYATDGPAGALRKAFLEANASIHARGQQNLEFRGMGTTSTALVLQPGAAWIGHVGDSRAYRVRDDQIEQLTFDHSWVWELAKRKNVDPDSLKGIASNFINRSLGPDALVEVDIEGPHLLRTGDVFLLCSDGLSNQLSDTEIGAIAQVLPPAEACQLLVQLANLRGGPDNITVIVARINGDLKTGSDSGQSTLSVGRPRERGSLITWPLLCLLVGVGLATAAIMLSDSGSSLGSVVAFGLAAISVLVGLAGLMWKHLRDRGYPDRQPQSQSVNVYRRVSCRIDKPLVDRMAHAEAILNEWVRSTETDIDWESNRQHREAALQSLKQGDSQAAFREYGRAIRPLVEHVSRDRWRSEGFHPMWERTSA